MSQMVSEAALRETLQPEDLSGPPAANRHRLPDERVGITHHFSIDARRTSVERKYWRRRCLSSGPRGFPTPACRTWNGPQA
jgi:hypothetical protein